VIIIAQINKKTIRIGEELLNYQNDLMKIIKYNDANDIVVEFQDVYKGKVHTNYYNFKHKSVKNPYHPEVCGVGIIGSKYAARLPHGKQTKEYETWRSMLRRCFDDDRKLLQPTYNDITCCNEWLLYENFYEWLHSQSNFNKWLNSKKWAIDKDIIVKGNKTYSPETCCLVPKNVNNLFIKCQNTRGKYPIGVGKQYKNFTAKCQNQFTGKTEPLGTYKTIEEAFQAYKRYKEALIKQVAKEEYDKGNITKQCYEAMMKYEVEITD
jgi:hypothetical protein